MRAVQVGPREGPPAPVVASAAATKGADVIDGLRTPLWQHQREAVDHARTRRGAMFAVRMGGGKTLTTIAMLHAWNARRVLVATPLSVVSTWPRELVRHSEWRWDVAALDEGPVAKRTAAAQLLLETTAARGARCVVVINHESLWRQPFRDLALATPWDAIVVDESHRAKAPGGKLSRFLADLGKRHPLTRRLGLTGTPMPHALASDAPVLTPTGWVPIGALKQWDLVIGADGTPTKVVGVWPQGMKQLYSARFSDGASVECTADHLWQVTTRGRNSRSLPPLVKRTDELADPLPLPNSNGKQRRDGRRGLLDAAGTHRWSIPIAREAELSRQHVPIDPYLLGLLLGDGHLGSSIGFTTADEQLAEEIRSALPAGVKLVDSKGGARGRASSYRLTSGKKGGSAKGKKRGPMPNPLLVAIGELGLRHHRSEDKFIPDSYLWNDARSRLAILQGLCDADGCSYGSTSKFTTTSERLARGVEFLIRSLGGFPQTSVQSARKVRLPNGSETVGRPQYHIFFRSPVNPFRLDRKRLKFRVSPRNPRRSIVTIEPTRVADATCITVDASDGLYVTKDFVVTHNSPMDLYAQARFLDPSVYGTSFQRFKMRYALLGGFEGREVIGFQRQDELMEKFRRFAFVANAKNLLDLPPELDVEIPVKLEAHAVKVYRSLERDFWVEVEQGTVTASNALVKLLRLQQLTSGVLRLDEGAGDQPISDAKAEALADLLADMPRGEKVVIFGRFTADIMTARRVAESEGRRFGEVSGRRKDLDQGRFPEDIDVLGVQIAAGGVGIDLSRASTAVFSSTGFNLGEYLQARARLHRPGQRQQVTFLHLLAEGTIDWRVYRALQRREEVVTALLEQGQKEAA